jgi:hypothetical protein
MCAAGDARVWEACGSIAPAAGGEFPARGGAAQSGHDDLQRPGLSAFRSSGAVHRPAPAGSSRLPGSLQRLLPRAHRIRSALLPGLVRRARPGPAGRATAAPGTVYPVDARDPPVQALHRIPAVLGHGRVLPHLRPRRHLAALTRRARPPPSGPPPNHPRSGSRTCSSRPCSPPPGSLRTRTISHWWPCPGCSACESSKPPARTSPTSARNTATGSCGYAARAPRSCWCRCRQQSAGPSTGQEAPGPAGRSC